jgi:ATP-binding cassette subfamily B protein
MRLVTRRGRQAWGIIPLRYKIGLGSAAGVIAVVSALNTAMPLLLGKLVDGIHEGVDRGDEPAAMYRRAGMILGLIAVVYLVREGLNVVRRALVENTCARLSRDMILDVLGRVIRTDFGALSKDRIGTLHGRVFRSVDGLVRLMKMAFLDFFPALFTGLFAIGVAVTKQPVLGLLMAGVVPSAVFLTLRQIMSQRRVRVKLIRSCEHIDGNVVELLGGLEYVRAADTSQQELDRLARATRHKMVVEYWHHLKMAFFGSAKALNEGFFHILVLGSAVYLAVTGHATFGDVLTFSILYMGVMAPLNEVHRVIDEGHEASIRVGDLLALRAQPVDPSFDVKEPSTYRCSVSPGGSDTGSVIR